MINHITMHLFNYENMLITVLSFKLNIKLFKLSELKMSLSLFCAIPNSNMTNTLSLSHTHTISFWNNQHWCIQKVSVLGEERCRLGRARMQETPYVCVPHSPGWACRDSRHREEAAEGFPIIPCSPYRCTLRTTLRHHGSTPGDNSCTKPQDKHPLKKSLCDTYFD